MDQKPSKYINMYFLGRIEPIANFYNNQDEAVECLKQLNKRVVIKSGKPVNKHTLLHEKFYYLTIRSENKFMELVELADEDVTLMMPRFKRRIITVDGDRAPLDSFTPPDDMLPPFPDGTRNRKRRRR
jgi:hypothetical protein